MKVILIHLFSLFLLSHVSNGIYTEEEAKLQSWAHESVRKDATQFWWLFKVNEVSYQDFPLVMYLQGGPGDSSTGFGNFMEIGRRDLNLSVRQNSWDTHANVLYVDTPVGSGFSQVFNGAFALNNTQIGKDLLQTFKGFMKKNPDFQSVPFYVFTESYGGKMAATFGVMLHRAIQEGTIKCNFKGIHMGDAAVSLEDSLASWPVFLHATGMIDQDQQSFLEEKYVTPVRKAIADREGALAMDLWIEMREVMANMTGRLNLWNIIHDEVPWRDDKPLTELMNGPVRRYLNVSNEWATQGQEVFLKLWADFMYPVMDEVEYLLNKTEVKIAVVSGQLDVVCSHLGAENWSHRLNWKGKQDFRAAKRHAVKGKSGLVEGYAKKFGQLSLYVIRDAGHSVPQDQLLASVHLLKDITRD